MTMPIEDFFVIIPFLISVIGGLFLVVLDTFAQKETPRKFLGAFALVFLGGMALSCLMSMGQEPQAAFSRMVVADDISRFLGVIFAFSAGLASLIAMGRMPNEGAVRGEFYALLLFATGGATLLTQAIDLIALFIGVETLSIPAYILAASMRRDPRSAEAGFKYFILGAFSSGFLVYGMALIYGATGSTGFAEISQAVSIVEKNTPILIIGVLLVLASLCFKIAAAPFHMWAPDVYQGSPTPATSFFATAVKAAAFAALLRVLFMAIPDMKYNIGDIGDAGWVYLIQFLAIATMTAANLVAILQTDVKRILAYSSVAHAGYLLIGLLAESQGGAAILFYLAAYTFMTAGAFAMVAFFEHKDKGTSLESYRGHGRRYPVASVMLTVFLFSLAGIPPTAGFFGKFYLFKVAIDQGFTNIIIIAVFNSMVSTYYYLKIMIYMYMQKEPETETTTVSRSMAIGVAAAICLFFVLAMGIYPAPYLEAAKASIASMF